LQRLEEEHQSSDHSNYCNTNNKLSNIITVPSTVHEHTNKQHYITTINTACNTQKKSIIQMTIATAATPITYSTTPLHYHQ